MGVSWPSDNQLREFSKSLRRFAAFVEADGLTASRNARDSRTGYVGGSTAGGGAPSTMNIEDEEIVVSPVERLVLAALDRGTGVDPTFDAVDRAWQLTAQIHELTRRAEGLLRRALPAADVPRGRVSTVSDCLACSEPAPEPRRGLCVACYHRWRRADRPELSVFVRGATAWDESRHVSVAR